LQSRRVIHSSRMLRADGRQDRWEIIKVEGESRETERDQRREERIQTGRDRRWERG